MNKIIFPAMVLALAGCGGADTTSTSDPTITSTPVIEATEDSPYRYKLSATDDDTALSALEWESSLPAWLTLDVGGAVAVDVEGGGSVDALAVTADANGNVFATISGCDVVKINPNGTQTTLTSISDGNCYGLISIGTKLYFSNYSDNAGGIYVFDTSNVAAGATIFSSKTGSGPLALIEKDSFIYVVNFHVNSIDKIEISNPSNRTEVLANLATTDGPYGLGFANNGDLYISLLFDHKVVRYNSELELDNSFNLALNYPTDVKVDIYDNIYVSLRSYVSNGSDGSGGVKKVESGGLSTTTIATGNVWGMTLNSQGELLWGNIPKNKIQKLETQAVALTGTPTREHVGEHEVSVTVSDGGDNDNTQAFTITVSAVNSEPTGDVTITGELKEGSTLTAENDLADTDGLGDISYQWYADGNAITDATSATLTLTADHVGKAITIEASYTDDFNFEGAKTSAATAIVTTNNLPTGTVTITGDPIVGEYLFVTNNIQDADGIYSGVWHWYANDIAIEGFAGGVNKLTSSQVGTVITVKFIYTDALGYDEEVTSAATAVVTVANSLPVGNVTITGDLLEGETLTASNDLQDTNGLGNIIYQWFVGDDAITDTTSTTFTLTSAHVGKSITVKASYTDGNGFEEVITSEATGFIVGLTSNPTQSIAANGAIMAMLQEDGAVMTWGDNTYGTMGHTPGSHNDTEVNGFPSYYYNPNAATINGLTDVTSIAVGYRFILALKDDGTVWAWGRNENGELGHEPGTNNDAVISDDYGNLFSDFDGDGNEYYNSTPQQVPGLSDVMAIDANYASAVALKWDGSVWTWGDNSFGQLGDDNGAFGIQSYSPVQVVDSAGTGTLSDIISIHASDFGMFATQYDGTLWAWGGNSTGSLGLGDFNDRLKPVQHSLTHVVDIAMSGQFNVALKTDGTVSYWGDSISTPTDSGLVDVYEIASAGNGAIALLANGSAMAWGMNISGQLGDGTIADIATPTTIFAEDKFVDVVMGEYFSAAILEDGSVKTWGSNIYGQLGHTPNSNGDIQPMVDGDIFNLDGVTIEDAAANKIGAPSSFTATVNGNEVEMTWSDVEGASHYNIYWHITPGMNKLNSSVFYAPGDKIILAGGKYYYLSVTAVDAAGNESSNSLEVVIDIPAT